MTYSTYNTTMNFTICFFTICVFSISISGVLGSSGSSSSKNVLVNRCCTHDKSNRECLTSLHQKSETEAESTKSVPKRWTWTPDENSGIRLNISFDGVLECPEDAELVHLIETQDSNINLSLYSNSYLQVNDEYFPKKDFCVDRLTQDIASVVLCQRKRENTPTVKKCCNLGHVIDFTELNSGVVKCKPSGDKIWSPVIYQDSYTKVAPNTILPHFVTPGQNGWCEGEGFIILSQRSFPFDRRHLFRVLPDGNILLKHRPSKWKPVDSSVSYCVDGLQNYPIESTDGVEMLSGLYTGLESDTLMIECVMPLTSGYEEDLSEYTLDSSLLYTIVMSVACFFLVLTITFLLLTMKKQHIHGWTLLAYLVSMLIQYLFLIPAHNIRYQGPSCNFVAIGAHFSLLLTFSWLSVINFDVWWTFRSLSTPQKSQEIRRFIFYVLFALGVPTTIVTVGKVLDVIYREDPENELIVPRYGENNCLVDDSAELPYLYGPIAFLLTCNFFFFAATLYYFLRNEKFAKSNTSCVTGRTVKYRIYFFMKLFIIAGVTWMFEIISWAATGENEKLPWYWVATDMVNILQSIGLFIIFVCNKEALKGFFDKLPCLSKIQSLLKKVSRYNGLDKDRIKGEYHHHQSVILEGIGLEMT